MYEIGKVYEFDGQKRKVIGMDGRYPVTTIDLEAEPEKSAPGIDVEAIRAEIRTELEAEQKDYVGLLKLLPLDKCNKEELLSVVNYIGREPPGEDAQKSEIISIILG